MIAESCYKYLQKKRRKKRKKKQQEKEEKNKKEVDEEIKAEFIDTKVTNNSCTDLGCVMVTPELQPSTFDVHIIVTVIWDVYIRAPVIR